MELICITKTYANKTVLQDLSCTIEDGSFCAIMAPSGAGKTTLLRLILGLEKPDSGQILGVPVRKSTLFQEDRLCPELSVLANVKLVLDRKTDPAPILRELGLSDSLQKPASQLSGGMARRTALARALACKSDLLILDEPFNGLDEENRIFAASIITKYRGGRTAILVTHRKEDLELLGITQCIRL